MRKPFFILVVAAMLLFAVGCAVTDYTAWPGHKTSAESKLWGLEISFSGFDPVFGCPMGGECWDGTYNYTVQYDNRAGTAPGGPPANIAIYSYRNPVISAFSWDGFVDRDGDDVQGNAGSLSPTPFSPAGKYSKWWVSDDRAAGCQFFTNIKQDFSDSPFGPIVASCEPTSEEIDANFDLHAAFGSFDELLRGIWSGAVGGNFTLEVTALRINGVSHPVETFSLYATHNGLRPTTWSLSYGPAVASAIQVILDNTQHQQAVHVGLEFAGGLSFDMPGTLIAFDHDILWQGM